MLPTKISDVHIYTFIPQMVEVMKKKFPELTICPVTYEENSEHYQDKVVTKTEFLELQKAEVLIADGITMSQIYHKLPNLQWMQLTNAGVEPLTKAVKQHLILPHYPITRCVSCQQMVEYVFAWIINNERGYHKMKKMQKEKVWANDLAKVPNHCPSLKGIAVGIAGIGEIGSALAGCLKAFNSNVLGYARSTTPQNDVQLDGYWHGDQLPEFLAKCDYIVNLLPSTPETTGLFGRDTLRSAKKKPVFINIGGSNVISNEDVLTAIENEWISLAVLDVFTEEPLLPSSPLWHHPKVIITPHLAGMMTADDVADSFKVNLERLSKHESLKNCVDWVK